jgi:hypothetical protein
MSPHRRILAIDAKNAEPIMIVIATSAAMKITLNRFSGVALLSIPYSIAVAPPHRRRRYLPPETTA